MEKGRELQMDKFRASHHWLLNFKHRHNIVSRKITRKLTRKNHTDEDTVRAKANEFIEKIKPLYAKNPAKMLNSDQCGFNIELYPERTLEVKGTRHIEGLVEAKKSLTHSYTLMPMISGDGRLLKPTLIVHQTPNASTTGNFGPRVLKSMFTHESILIKTTTSGKVDKNILQQWATDVLFKAPGTNNSTLLLDAYTGHRDKNNLDTNKPKNFNYSIEYIPENTTSKCQPLDKEPNRTLKQMMRTMSEAFLVVDARITTRIRLSTRDAIDMLQVLILNQIDSPRFQTWIVHAWKSCGYTSKQMSYISPNKYCLDIEVTRQKCALCEPSSFRSAFIRCGWCTLCICEYHFFFHGQIHYCSKYVK